MIVMITVIITIIIIERCVATAFSLQRASQGPKRFVDLAWGKVLQVYTRTSVAAVDAFWRGSSRQECQLSFEASGYACACVVYVLFLNLLPPTGFRHRDTLYDWKLSVSRWTDYSSVSSRPPCIRHSRKCGTMSLAGGNSPADHSLVHLNCL